MIREFKTSDFENIYELGELLHSNYRKLYNLDSIINEEYNHLFIYEDNEKISVRVVYDLTEEVGYFRERN